MTVVPNADIQRDSTLSRAIGKGLATWTAHFCILQRFAHDFLHGLFSQNDLMAISWWEDWFEVRLNTRIL